MPLTFIPRERYHLVVRPEAPDWVAVNATGAEVLRRLSLRESPAAIAGALTDVPGLDEPSLRTIVGNFARETRRIWQQPESDGYAGRAAHLRPDRLRELWLHVNSRCNLACRHCLVSSGPQGENGLPTESLLALIAEARHLGAKTFFVTGGEPLLRPDIAGLLGAMLSGPEAHAVVLTNGSLVREPFLRDVGRLDSDRLHLQISLDGSHAALNDRIRSPGSFEMALEGIRLSLAAGLNVTVATVVLDENLDDLPALVELLSEQGVRSLHLMWQHVRERGAREPRAALDRLSRQVLELKRLADSRGLEIDNFEAYLAIANGEPGVKRDLTNACWDSLAVYLDGRAYPSAALVGVEELCGGDVVGLGLERVWLESPAFEHYRRRTALNGGDVAADPFLFLHGGGDPDHAYFYGRLNGGVERDPYIPLYQAIIQRLVDEVVADRMALLPRQEGLPLAYQLMGQDGLGCPVQAGAMGDGAHRIDFAHSNCVLNQDVIGHARQIVRDYYGEAAVRPKSEICCPVQASPQDMAHIPPHLLKRTYGCGSPVMAASIAPGETVVDLGCGVGVECFIASKLVGAEGRIIGVDMTPDMLATAGAAADQVSANLGYANVGFVRGYLEALPLAGGSVDAILSNCVINLSPEKLKAFSEILRVLRPGGRMVISDIVAGSDVPEAVKYNPRLKSECIGGALPEEMLLALLSKLGFANVRILHRVPWREVEGVQFLSDTLVAKRPRGEPPPPYLLDAQTALVAEQPHNGGCVVCGEPVEYLDEPIDATCHLCGAAARTWARCRAGHFVCDRCHGGDYTRFVHSFAAQCALTDPVEVFLRMRSGFPFPLHGPEHHALVPAAFLTAYRNSGGDIQPRAFEHAIEEGSRLPGGTCAYWGGCAAALGVGVAYSAILKASPLKARPRQTAQTIVARILARLAAFRAARCCRRESLLALQIAAEASAEFLPVTIRAGQPPACDQNTVNTECIGGACPFAPLGPPA